MVQTLGIHGPFYDYRSQKRSYVETVKTFDILFADFMKKLHEVNFFRQGGILVVTGDHRVMLPISSYEQENMGFFTPQYVPLVIFGNLPYKIDSHNFYSHVDLHYSLQWLLLDHAERHQYQRNLFIIVLDIDNIICYITIPNNGEWHNEKNNPRHQKYPGEAKRRVA